MGDAEVEMGGGKGGDFEDEDEIEGRLAPFLDHRQRPRPHRCAKRYGQVSR